MLTDETNTVVWEALYKPFGEGEVNPNSSITNNLRLPGQYYNEETGFHYNYFRYYDPGTGRYLKADPIGLAGGLNLFVYVSGNPINWVDPDGLEIRLQSGDAFGISGANHLYYYSTETGEQKGMAGSSGWNSGNGGSNSYESDPYLIIDTNGLSDADFMRRLRDYPGWETDPYCVWLNDCHEEAEEACAFAGGDFPENGWPTGRIDYDDNVMNYIFNQFNSYINRLIGGAIRR